MTGDASARGEVEYHCPTTVSGVRRRLDQSDGEVHVVAGGQTLLLLIRRGFVDADALVDVSTVPSLSGVSIADGRVSLGAGTTYADLSDHVVADRVAMLGDACSVIADRQVRNLGTVGGAVCHADPSLDVLAPLCSLDATVHIGSVDGRRSLPIDEFFVGHMRTALEPDELLERIVFELPDAERSGTAYVKHSAVEAGWSTAGVATSVTIDDGRFATVRVGITALADTPTRAPSVERELTGRHVTEAAVASASEAVTADVDPITDAGGSAAYKRQLAPRLVERSLGIAVERAGGDL